MAHPSALNAHVKNEKPTNSLLEKIIFMETNASIKNMLFEAIFKICFPDNVKDFFDILLQLHDATQREKFMKGACTGMERCLYKLLQGMELSGSKEELRKLQKTFSDLVQTMAIPLHDDTAPAIPYDSFNIYRYEDEHCPLFTRAVKLKLAPEALLLYDAGAVGNKELSLLAKDSDVQKVLKSEEDKSVLAVFLRKVLHKPRSLQSLAEIQVSRLLGCHAPEVKEQRARSLSLPLDFNVERVLLRRQCDRYRAALKLAEDEDEAEES